uniref:Uncharacterized protein n=1 Tax=Siphoviridae sp. ctCCX1 TaxID=2823567 RepID=A0A8S5LDL1_9CAUD|nr:MAG TPA: hypothetical protein [Siphoviridae sp. ctCCX1]
MTKSLQSHHYQIFPKKMLPICLPQAGVHEKAPLSS